MDSEAIEKGWGPKAFCPPDEHYIPTLLAALGRDNETDCRVHCARVHRQMSLPACGNHVFFLCQNDCQQWHGAALKSTCLPPCLSCIAFCSVINAQEVCCFLQPL